jgi:hypothetical protein
LIDRGPVASAGWSSSTTSPTHAMRICADAAFLDEESFDAEALRGLDRQDAEQPALML